MNRADPQEIYSLLQRLGIPYRKTQHPAASSMEELTGVEQTLGAVFCKNLFLCNRQKTEFFLLLIEENKRFRTAEISKKLGRSRLSFGPEEQLYEYLGVHPGAITPLGLAFDESHQIQLLMDRDLLPLEEICVHPCVNTASVAIKTRDLLDVYFPFTGHAPQLLDITGEIAAD